MKPIELSPFRIVRTTARVSSLRPRKCEPHGAPAQRALKHGPGISVHDSAIVFPSCANDGAAKATEARLRSTESIYDSFSQHRVSELKCKTSERAIRHTNTRMVPVSDGTWSRLIIASLRLKAPGSSPSKSGLKSERGYPFPRQATVGLRNCRDSLSYLREYPDAARRIRPVPDASSPSCRS
jgi:hypothetical protein